MPVSNDAHGELHRMGSLSSGPSDARHRRSSKRMQDFGVQVNTFFQKFRQKVGAVQDDVEDTRVAEMADIIRTYRDVQEPNADDVPEEVVHWVDKLWFECMVCIVILLNTVLIALETDLGDQDEREVVWYVLEGFFCLLFLIEVALKVIFHSWRWILRDCWNLLTTVLALLLLVDAAILSPLGHYGTLRVVSLTRVLVVVRLLRIVRLQKELNNVLSGLVGSLPSVSWVAVIMVLMLYIFSVWTTSIVGKSEDYVEFQRVSGGFEHEEYFGTIGKSMFTLLQVLTLDSWSSGIARFIVNRQWYMSFFFIVFLIMTTFGLLNLIVSLIVEQTMAETKKAESRAAVRAEKSRREELESIREVFLLADSDYNGEIDLKEFLSAVQDQEVLWRLRQLELPVDDATQLFQVIDGTGSRSLTMKEFIDGCSKLKGSARSKDLLQVQAQADTMAKQMDMLGLELQDTERMLALMDEIADRMVNRFAPTVASSRRKIAQRVGGSAPTVPFHGGGRVNRDEPHDLAHGNKPNLPKFPSLL